MTARTFLLVHGACHGAWCWDAIIPVFAARGYRAVAIDLPGRRLRGIDGWRHTLCGHGAAIAAAAARLGEPVVAVGHSMGGQMISAAAELAPERFARLVYLSAFLPVDADSIAAMSRHNSGSLLPEATKVSALTARLRIVPSAATPVFYGDCTADQVGWASARLVDEAVRPSLDRIQLSDDRFGRVPRSYIRLSEDRAITPALQDWMLSRQRCERVITLAASHSPFLSQPEALVETLLAAAA